MAETAGYFNQSMVKTAGCFDHEWLKALEMPFGKGEGSLVGPSLGRE